MHLSMRLMFSVGSLCLLSQTTLLAQAEDWAQWRGPNRADQSSSTGLLSSWEETTPQLAFHVQGCGKGYASVSLEGDQIFTMGDIDQEQCVICLSREDGTVQWTSPVCEKSNHLHPGSRCTPTIDGNRLYVVASNGVIACLDRNDGEVLWSHNFADQWDGEVMSAWGFAESPLVDGDLVLCTPGGAEAMVVALDKETGEQAWASTVPRLGRNGSDGAGYCSMVISHAAGVKQYVQLIGRGLIGIRAEDGEFLWGYNDIANDTANIPTPIVSGDDIFVSTGYGTGAALLHIVSRGNQIEAEEAYFLRSRTFQNHHGQMILRDGHLFGGHGHNNGFPICIRLEDGEVAWGGDQRGVGRNSAAITYAEDHLYFRYQSGVIALIEATTEEYRLKGSFTPVHVEGPSWAQPVIADGLLYLREQDHLMCYDLRTSSTATTLGQNE